MCGGREADAPRPTSPLTSGEHGWGASLGSPSGQGRVEDWDIPMNQNSLFSPLFVVKH